VKMAIILDNLFQTGWLLLDILAVYLEDFTAHLIRTCNSNLVLGGGGGRG